MTANARRALAAAAILVFMTCGSTAMSSLFVAYRTAWGLTSADIAIVFSVYVATLLPTLLFFGDLADRFGRRPIVAIGILSMLSGVGTLLFAHGLPWLIAARLMQGIGVGLSIGAVTAALTDAYKGSLPIGNMFQVIMAVGLFSGPVISAVAFNYGGGVNLSYIPTFIIVALLLTLVPVIVEKKPGSVAAANDVPYAPEAVRAALRLALPKAFVSWAALSLFLSLVPAYLAATLHANNPAIGAGAIFAAQAASIIVALALRNVPVVAGGISGAFVAIFGVALLIAGTSLNNWPLIVAATMLVGGGAAVSSGTAFGTAGRIGRGQRAHVYARMYLAAYAGYSIPVLSIGLIAVRTGFTEAFTIVTAVLALITFALPFLVEREPQSTCPAAAEAAA